jgi:hypothetical protein
VSCSNAQSLSLHLDSSEQFWGSGGSRSIRSRILDIDVLTMILQAQLTREPIGGMGQSLVILSSHDHKRCCAQSFAYDPRWRGLPDVSCRAFHASFLEVNNPRSISSHQIEHCQVAIRGLLSLGCRRKQRSHTPCMPTALGSWMLGSYSCSLSRDSHTGISHGSA